MKCKPYWHLYHEEFLVEFTARKRLIKEVKGKLPPDLVKAGEAYYQTWVACHQAWEAYFQTWKSYCQRESCRQALEAYRQTKKAYRQATKLSFKALKVYRQVYSKHKKFIEVLHAKECPDCLWDGGTIFPGGVV